MLIIKEVLINKSHVNNYIYHYVFDEMYNHLDINIKDGSIRKNFKLLEITE